MKSERTILLSRKARLAEILAKSLGEGFLFVVACTAALAVLFIFYFIGKDSIPFLRSQYLREFFTGLEWYPSGSPPRFGAVSLFVGTGLVTLGAAIVAVPLGVTAAVCLSDVMSFSARQFIKPVVEILAAIPSVAYGFFALVVMAPLLQNNGGDVFRAVWFVVSFPFLILFVVVFSDFAASGFRSRVYRMVIRVASAAASGGVMLWMFFRTGQFLASISVTTGTNALNVSVILGIMALPTIVSVSEDALQAVGRELREGSFALGATRAETLVKTVIPAASSGICAAILLGIMRALGETMVVWMASGNASQIPQPFYNYLAPIRTLTATIAGDMGEADHVTGSARFHVLFVMGLCLLVFCFFTNLITEWFVARQRRKLMGE